MNQKELKDLIDFLVEKDITEFELERGDVKVRVKRGAEPVVIPAPSMPLYPSIPSAAGATQPAPGPTASAPATPATPAAEPAEESGLHIVKSPIVGTFYESPSPDAPPFVRVGERVQPGKVLCIIESMKLMNEIESETSGTIESKLVMNGQPVEYGEALFAVRAV